MSTERRQARKLDEALRGAAPDDETGPLTQTADELRDSFLTDVPPADRQRALFLSGVTSLERSRFSPVRVLVPALTIGILAFAVMVGQRALPGEQLYPLREAMNAVGIGEASIDEVDAHLHESAKFIRQARLILEENPDRALALAVQALEELGPARELIPELNGRQDEKLEQIEDLEDEAVDLIEEAIENRDRSEIETNGSSGSDDDDSGPGDGGDDSSGSGSGDSDDDGDGDDSSGSGSGDSDEDSSGSGNDDTGDDSSGPGSGGSDDDSSGSGSDDPDDDSSGSGSGSDDDSSGSGND